eukprot:5970545-Ditylum_brightwellii.AAC.1
MDSIESRCELLRRVYRKRSLLRRVYRKRLAAEKSKSSERSRARSTESRSAIHLDRSASVGY